MRTKQLLLILMLIFGCIPLSFAAKTGVFAILTAGYGRVMTPDASAFDGTNNSRDLGDLGFEAGAGINVTPYLGAAVTFLYTGYSKYKGGSSELQYISSVAKLLARAYYPLLNDKLNLSAEIGLAFVEQEVDYQLGSNNINAAEFSGQITGGLHFFDNVRPTYGVEISYLFDKHIGVAIRASHVKRSGNLDRSREAIAAINYIGGGVMVAFA